MSESNRGTHALFVLTLLTYLIVGGAILASKEREVSRTIEANSADQGQPPKAPDPAVRSDAIDQNGTSEARQNSDLQAQWHAANANWAGVWVSFFGLAGLAVTAYLAYLAWREAKRSADADNDTLELTRNNIKASEDRAIERDKLMAAQLAAAEASAAAAQKSADAARDLARQDRAWLFATVLPGSPFPMPDPDQQQEIAYRFTADAKVEIVNRGKSPAVIHDMLVELYWITEAPKPRRPFNPREWSRPGVRATSEPLARLELPRHELVSIFRDPEEDRPQNTRKQEIIVDGGQSITVDCGFVWNFNNAPRSRTAYRNSDFYFECRVRYTDVRSITCETSVCQRLGAGPGLFQEPVGPEYNYRK